MNEAKKELKMNKQEQKLNITGMTCNHCVGTVEKTLTGITGVENVTVSLENNSAQVVYDAEQTNTEQLIASVNETNYNASI
ncbi:MAG: cation transporter [Leptospirales bacterium]